MALVVANLINPGAISPIFPTSLWLAEAMKCDTREHAWQKMGTLGVDGMIPISSDICFLFAKDCHSAAFFWLNTIMSCLDPPLRQAIQLRCMRALRRVLQQSTGAQTLLVTVKQMRLGNPQPRVTTQRSTNHRHEVTIGMLIARGWQVTEVGRSCKVLCAPADAFRDIGSKTVTWH